MVTESALRVHGMGPFFGHMFCLFTREKNGAHVAPELHFLTPERNSGCKACRSVTGGPLVNN